MRKFVGLLSVLGCLVVGGWSVAEDAQDVVLRLPHGHVNWTKQTITVTGTGVPNLRTATNAGQARMMAERAAKTVAWRNIVEAVKGVVVTGTTTSGAVMDGSDTVTAEVQGIVRDFEVVDIKYYSDGAVDVIVSMPLAKATEPVVSEATKERQKVATTGTEKYSGLIVDARGHKLAQVLAPRVYDASNDTLVYGPGFVSETALAEAGVAVYVKSLEAAKASARVGANPVVVKMMGAKGKSDIKISDVDAMKLREEGVNYTFLTEARVFIVVD